MLIQIVWILVQNNIEWPYKSTNPIDGSWWVIFDGIEQNHTYKYNELYNLFFSAESQKLVKAIDKGNESDFVVSRDGNHSASILKEGEDWSILIDGITQQHHGIIGPVALSLDGKHHIYIVNPKGSIKEFAVVDGIAQPERDANLIFPNLALFLRISLPSPIVFTPIFNKS